MRTVISVVLFIDHHTIIIITPVAKEGALLLLHLQDVHARLRWLQPLQLVTNRRCVSRHHAGMRPSLGTGSAYSWFGVMASAGQGVRVLR